MSNDDLMLDATIQLHTRLAQSLFNYSWQHGKMGLIQFAKLTSTLLKAANQDDPYADWILIKTYQGLNDAHENIKNLEKKLTIQLEQIRGIAATPVLNAHPAIFPLKFSTNFAYMGAILLADADFVIRQMLTIKRLSVAEEDINPVIKTLQDVFAIPRQWQQTGITRKDLMEKNQKAQDTITLLGELPDSILNQKTDFHSISQYRYADTTTLS